jgi:uncharacterized protein
MRSFLLQAVSVLALGCACNRTEEPAAPGVAEAAPGAAMSAPSTPSAPSAPTGSAAPSAVCTVPFGDPAPVVGKAVSCPKDPTGDLKMPLGKVTFLDAPSAPQVEVELARDDAARERGLMYRTHMPENRGMLFSWEDERVRNFWMHNTCIPLDMLYIDKQGIIAGILEQVPTLNDAPRGVRCPVAHVLELNAGWARAHGLAPGMKVKIEG